MQVAVGVNIWIFTIMCATRWTKDNKLYSQCFLKNKYSPKNKTILRKMCKQFGEKNFVTTFVPFNIFSGRESVYTFIRCMRMRLPKCFFLYSLPRPFWLFHNSVSPVNLIKGISIIYYWPNNTEHYTTKKKVINTNVKCFYEQKIHFSHYFTLQQILTISNGLFHWTWIPFFNIHPFGRVYALRFTKNIQRHECFWKKKIHIFCWIVVSKKHVRKKVNLNHHIATFFVVIHTIAILQ